MTSGVRVKLSDCSPELRRRLEASLAASDVQPVSRAGNPARTREIIAVAPRRGNSSAGRGPNKTEQAYNLRFLAGEGRYEAITLRLPGGSRYTPDWMSVCPLGFVHLHEVKGAYRHPSQGRALTAWREARAAFPCFRFHWAVWSGREWRLYQNHEDMEGIARELNEQRPHRAGVIVARALRSSRKIVAEIEANPSLHRMAHETTKG